MGAIRCALVAIQKSAEDLDPVLWLLFAVYSPLSKLTGEFVWKHEALLLLTQQDELFPAERLDRNLSQSRCQRVETLPVPATNEVAGFRFGSE